MSKSIINIGFDFGTSSTKICYYDVLNETHHFFVFDKRLNDQSRYCKPCIIRFSENKLFFNGLPFGKKFNLFKVDMHCKTYVPDSIDLNVSIKGYQLVALFTANILKIIIPYLNKKYDYPKITLQFGVPVDHLSNTKLPDSEKEKMFRLAFGIGILLSETKINDFEGMNSSDIITLLNDSENKYLDLGNRDDLFSIYPETIAGVGSLLSNNTLERRFRYSIVDIGAGTTDISFFHYGDISEPGGKIYIYHSKTTDIGTQNNSTNLKLAIQELQKYFKIGFGNSKYLSDEQWSSDFNLLFLGGGSRGRLKDFTNDMELTIKGERGTRKPIAVKKIKFPFPNDTFDSENKMYLGWKDWFDFLGVSYGLSYPGPMLPPYNPQVPPLIKDDIPGVPDESLTPDVG